MSEEGGRVQAEHHRELVQNRLGKWAGTSRSCLAFSVICSFVYLCLLKTFSLKAIHV